MQTLTPRKKNEWPQRGIAREGWPFGGSVHGHRIAGHFRAGPETGRTIRAGEKKKGGRVSAEDKAPAAGRPGEIHEPALSRDEPVPAPARAQPRRLVPLGGRGVRKGGKREPPRARQHRVLHLPLVPRHGGGVVRGRGDRPVPERTVRRRQGGPGGAT